MNNKKINYGRSKKKEGEGGRNPATYSRAKVLIDLMWTLDNIAYILQIPIEQIHTQIKFRDANRPFKQAKGDRRMEAIRLVDIDDYAVWRVPNSSFLRYCSIHGIDVETMMITPTQQINQKTEVQSEPEET